MIRTLKNEFEGNVFYSSSFNTETGSLVRLIEEPEYRNDEYRDYELPDLAKWLEPNTHYKEKKAFRDRWAKKFGRRAAAFSPVPETVDISITDWCNFGCSYCYQDSTKEKLHAPDDHVANTIKAFKEAPYQIAIGGGEPTAHPAFPDILASAFELGSIPNYTTAGHIWRPEVIEATNSYSGGVSLTYHLFRGLPWFKKTYRKWRAALDAALNVHLIADRNVVTSLQQLRLMQKEVGPVSVILLAYYPDVGRSNITGIMPKKVYHKELPEEIKRCVDSGMTMAFSEGLLPYFLSRPNMGIDTKYAMGAEGRFSCYINPKGWMSSTSFKPTGTFSELDTEIDRRPEKEVCTWKGPALTLQEEWEQGTFFYDRRRTIGTNCDGCKKRPQCHTPNVNHYFVCAYAENNDNNPPLSQQAKIATFKEMVFKRMVYNDQDSDDTYNEKRKKAAAEVFAEIKDEFLWHDELLLTLDL